MWAIEGEFGLVSGLRAVGTSLLGVRGADRDVQGGAGVTQGRQVSARDEHRDLHLSRAVGRLSCCVYQRGDRVVSHAWPRPAAPVSREPFLGRLHKARVRKAQRP